MKLTTKVQLSTMMFLEFFTWGAWFVTMGTYLMKGHIKATEVQTGVAYGTQALGAILAPFIIGLIADRFFSAQKILGFLHIVGAALMYFLSQQTEFSSFYSLVLIYMIIYMPTLALVNAITLKQVSDPKKEFARIRMWGTIGWIVAGLIIGYLNWEQDASDLKNTFLLSAGLSLFFGVFSFFLPNTPPPKAGQKVTVREILGLDALKLLRDKNYLFFFIASILICIPLAFYYGQANVFLNETGMTNAAGKMTLGQIAETVFLFLMPWFLFRYNIKTMLLIGMIAWATRYVCFGFGDAGPGIWLLYAGIVLHGICYDFFFVTGQIYTDERAGERIRASAQGMITLATYGVGMLIGFWVAGQIAEYYKTPTGHDWKSIWLIPAGFAGILVILFMFLFKDPGKIKTTD